MREVLVGIAIGILISVIYQNALKIIKASYGPPTVKELAKEVVKEKELKIDEKFEETEGNGEKAEAEEVIPTHEVREEVITTQEVKEPEPKLEEPVPTIEELKEMRVLENWTKLCSNLLETSSYWNYLATTTTEIKPLKSAVVYKDACITHLTSLHSTSTNNNPDEDEGDEVDEDWELRVEERQTIFSRQVSLNFDEITSPFQEEANTVTVKVTTIKTPKEQIDSLIKEASQKINEYITTEMTYVKNLDNLLFILSEFKYSTLFSSREFVKTAHFCCIYSLTSVLQTIHSEFLKSLPSSIEVTNNEKSLEDIQKIVRTAQEIFASLRRFLPLFPVLSNYAIHYKQFCELYTHCTSTYEDFRTLLEKSQKQIGGELLQSLAITPIQRLPRYPLLGKELTNFISKLINKIKTFQTKSNISNISNTNSNTETETTTTETDSSSTTLTTFTAENCIYHSTEISELFQQLLKECEEISLESTNSAKKCNDLHDIDIQCAQMHHDYDMYVSGGSNLSVMLPIVSKGRKKIYEGNLYRDHKRSSMRLHKVQLFNDILMSSSPQTENATYLEQQIQLTAHTGTICLPIPSPTQQLDVMIGGCTHWFLIAAGNKNLYYGCTSEAEMNLWVSNIQTRLIENEADIDECKFKEQKHFLNLLLNELATNHLTELQTNFQIEFVSLSLQQFQTCWWYLLDIAKLTSLSRSSFGFDGSFSFKSEQPILTSQSQSQSQEKGVERRRSGGGISSQPPSSSIIILPSLSSSSSFSSFSSFSSPSFASIPLTPPPITRIPASPQFTPQSSSEMTLNNIFRRLDRSTKEVISQLVISVDCPEEDFINGRHPVQSILFDQRPHYIVATGFFFEYETSSSSIRVGERPSIVKVFLFHDVLLATYFFHVDSKLRYAFHIPIVSLKCEDFQQAGVGELAIHLTDITTIGLVGRRRSYFGRIPSLGGDECQSEPRSRENSTRSEVKRVLFAPTRDIKFEWLPLIMQLIEPNAALQSENGTLKLPIFNGIIPNNANPLNPIWIEPIKNKPQPKEITEEDTDDEN